MTPHLTLRSLKKSDVVEKVLALEAHGLKPVGSSLHKTGVDKTRESTYWIGRLILSL